MKTHGHGHHHHDSDRRYLACALALILAFTAAEAVIGSLVGSIALLSDAAHLLTDAAALALAVVAMTVAARPPRGGWTYGFKRVEILSALVNGLSLTVIAGYLVYEAVARLLLPTHVEGLPVLETAAAGVVVNLVTLWLIGRSNRQSLNVEGAFQHVRGDLWAFLATAAGAVVIIMTGFSRADSIASLLVSVPMMIAGGRLVRESMRVLLELAPKGIDPARVEEELVEHGQVVEVRDLHVWTITSNLPALSAHVLVADDGDCHAVRRELADLLRERHGIDHSTLQVDHPRKSEPRGCPLVTSARA